MEGKGVSFFDKQASKNDQVILLINPPSSFLMDERVFPALGILRVAAVYEQAGAEVEVLDLAGREDLLADRLNGEKPDRIGISATTPQMPAVTKMISVIRASWPDVKIILGGPHVTLTLAAQKGEVKRGELGRAHRATERMKQLADILVSGDGDRAALKALEDNAPAIIDADDVRSPLWMDKKEYGQGPWPARHLIDLSSYHYKIDGHDTTTIIGQLACPFSCGFCGGRNSPSLRVARARTTEDILNEVRFLHNVYGYTGFMFYDDELNVNKGIVGLMNGIADLQDSIGVEFALRGFVKSELFTMEQAEAMKRAGFEWILCGFEAADDRILTNIRKRATLEDNTRAVDITKKAGMKIKSLMSIGHAGESDKSVEAIKKWLVDMETDDFDCTVITPYPGTPYHDEAVKNGDVWTYTQPDTGDRLHEIETAYDEKADYYKGIPGEYKSYVFTDYLSAEELTSARDNLEVSVRKTLNLPFNNGITAEQFEHSMGQK